MGQERIQDAVKEEFEKRANRTRLIADDVVNELRSIAFANIADYVSWGRGEVKILDSESISRDAKRAIIAVHDTKYGIKIVLGDKKGALELLGRHLGIFEKDNKQKDAALGISRIERVIVRSGDDDS
jgi:phage terminase small subunit